MYLGNICQVSATEHELLLYKEAGGLATKAQEVAVEKSLWYNHDGSTMPPTKTHSFTLAKKEFLGTTLICHCYMENARLTALFCTFFR